MKPFDYIFYKLAKFYYKKDGSDAIRAIAFLSMIQTLLFGAFIISILKKIFGPLVVANYSNLSSMVGLVIGLVVYIFNTIRYKKKYWALADRWRNKETSKQNIIGNIFVIFALILPFLIWLYMGTAAYR